MKKLFLSFIMVMMCLCNICFAQEINEVAEILMYRQTAVSADNYLSENSNAKSLLKDYDRVNIFSSGDTTIQMILPAFAEINDNSTNEVATILDDALLQEYLASFQYLPTKQAELTEIANQVRNLYRRARLNYIYYGADGSIFIDEGNRVAGAIGPNMAGLSDIYVLNDAYNISGNTVEFDSISGKVLLWQDESGNPILVYDVFLSQKNNNGNINNPANGFGNNGNTSMSGSGNGGNTSTSGAGNKGTNPSGGSVINGIDTSEMQPVVYNTAPDVNQYADWEFPAYDEARSAEFKVVEHCWGEDSHLPQNLIDMESNWGEIVLSIGYNVNFTYQFNLASYYAQDTEEKENEALYLLTEHNKKLFIEEIFEDVVEDIRITGTDRDGNEYVDENATMTARQEAWDKLDEVVWQIRNYYGKIDVIAENYNPKEWYVYNEYITDLDNRIFVQNNEGKLFGIKTDKYNDVFKQHDLGGGMTDIINSSEEGIRQYRFAGGTGEIGNFYLCENCSLCDDGCGQFVASGKDPDSVLLLYFSKYCAEHACRFVWEWQVDPNNSPDCEGLKCRERRLDGFDYCADHKCRICAAGIVGVSIVDATAFADQRDTGSKNRERYSNYCVDHKCMAFSCQEARLNIDTTGVADSNANVTSPLYCAEHNCRCNVVIDGEGRICNNPVSKAAYEQTLRMICQTHLDNLSAFNGSGMNKFPPKMGICAQCGAFTSIYFNGTKCNSCLKANFYAEAQNDLELQIAIRVAKAMAGLDGNNHLDKNSTGLLVNICDKNGNVLYPNVNLATWRAQESGLYYSETKNGQTYMGYGLNCTDAALNVLARVFDDANATLVLSEKGRELTVADEYIVQDVVTGEVYSMANLENRGSCMIWDRWEDNRDSLGTYGMVDIWPENGSAQEQVEALNSCISYNTNTKERHTAFNTGRDITYTIDGVTYQGKVFTSYGTGNGVGDNTYAPAQYSLYAKDNTIYKVNFKVSASGELEIDSYRQYYAKVITACDFV
ncbi:MAG: hypothetical protein J6M02_02195 [Clostridia bacterium]|nr:hypothetical protein [Clostridia bacterium]